MKNGPKLKPKPHTFGSIVPALAKNARAGHPRNDYFVAFAQYESAERFSKSTPNAEPPLVLVRQLEWIDEPERGHFIPKKEERIAEWQVGWLHDHKRTPNSIEEFMKHPREEGPQ